MAVYTVSDLHGQYNTFIKGLEKIGFSDNDELYCIGDAIDRGPDGIRILQYIKDRKNMDLIIGNHEFMMLNGVSPDGDDSCDGRDCDLWLYYNGGTKTFEKYHHLTRNDREALLMWLNHRYVIKTIEAVGRKFCLTHSYYKPEFENKMYFEMEYPDVWDIVWKSIYRDGSTHGIDIYSQYPDYTFITGHVPVQRLWLDMEAEDDINQLRIHQENNLIDIDGGCSIGYHPDISNGALFLRLDDMKVFPIPL